VLGVGAVVVVLAHLVGVLRCGVEGVGFGGWGVGLEEWGVGFGICLRYAWVLGFKVWGVGVEVGGLRLRVEG